MSRRDWALTPVSCASTALISFSAAASCAAFLGDVGALRPQALGRLLLQLGAAGAQLAELAGVVEGDALLAVERFAGGIALVEVFLDAPDHILLPAQALAQHFLLLVEGADHAVHVRLGVALVVAGGVEIGGEPQLLALQVGLPLAQAALVGRDGRDAPRGLLAQLDLHDALALADPVALAHVDALDDAGACASRRVRPEAAET